MFLLPILQALTLSLEENDRWLLEWGEVNKYSIRFSYFVAMGMDKNDYCFVGLDKEGNSYDLKIFKDEECLGKTIYQNAVDSEIDNKIVNLGIEIDTEKYKNVTFIDIEEIRYRSQQETAASNETLRKKIDFSVKKWMVEKDGFSPVVLYCSEGPDLPLLDIVEGTTTNIKVVALNNITVQLINYNQEKSMVKFKWTMNGVSKHGYGKVRDDSNTCHVILRNQNIHTIQLPKETRLEFIEKMTVIDNDENQIIFKFGKNLQEALKEVKDKPINMDMCENESGINYCPNLANEMNGKINFSNMMQENSVAVIKCDDGYQSRVEKRTCRKEDGVYFWDGPEEGFGCTKVDSCSDSNCKNGGVCDPSTLRCQCKKDYTGFHCEIEVLEFYCGENALKFESYENGSFKCECGQGFIARDNTKCKRRNTCDLIDFMNGKVVNRKRDPYFEGESVLIQCDLGGRINAVCNGIGNFYPDLTSICDSQYSIRAKEKPDAIIDISQEEKDNKVQRKTGDYKNVPKERSRSDDSNGIPGVKRKGGDNKNIKIIGILLPILAILMIIVIYLVVRNKCC